ncbi:MAG: hypothetical protein E7225_02245 [Clostridiales bacterium]|nr:hypothetical protein [Clostridiales bacterium]
MKRLIAFTLVAVIVFSLVACGSGGDVSTYGRRLDESDFYSEEEVISAMDVVEKYFKKEFRGCELKNLEFKEEKSLEAADEWAEQYNDEKAIILISEFYVDSSGGDGSFEPDSTYSNWQWILTKSGGEDWKLQTWGY